MTFRCEHFENIFHCLVTHTYTVDTAIPWFDTYFRENEYLHKTLGETIIFPENLPRHHVIEMFSQK
jgi:hypothetical protein